MLSFDEYLEENLASEEFAGLTQSEVAKQTGIKQPMIARIERGQMPKPMTLRKLAKVLKAHIVFTGDTMYVEPVKTRKNNAFNKEETVTTAPEPIFKEEVKSEISISNVVNFEGYKRKREPLTIRNMEKQEDYHEDIRFAIG
mgnify:CR=1 FL=1